MTCCPHLAPYLRLQKKIPWATSICLFFPKFLPSRFQGVFSNCKAQKYISWNFYVAFAFGRLKEWHGIRWDLWCTKKDMRALVWRWSSVTARVRLFLAPWWPWGFIQLLGVTQKARCIRCSPRGFLKGLLHFHESLALSGDPPSDGEAAGISSAWLPESLPGQVYCSDYFSLTSAREIVAHIAGHIRRASPFGCKTSVLSSSRSLSSLPPAKGTSYGSRTGSAISSTELNKEERRLKALKTYGMLWLNRK